MEVKHFKQYHHAIGQARAYAVLLKKDLEAQGHRDATVRPKLALFFTGPVDQDNIRAAGDHCQARLDLSLGRDVEFYRLEADFDDDANLQGKPVCV